MSHSPLFDRADFEIPDGVIHVCNGGATPFLRSNLELWRRYASLKGMGAHGRETIEGEILTVQECVGKLWHVGANDIGFTSSVAEGVSMVAESIDWREGDNVCTLAREYPSLAGPFALQRRGIELRLAEDVSELAKLVDKRTKVIAISYVSYFSGERVDLKPLRALADSAKAMLVVDYTQGAGYLPIDASITDFAFSASYKWMLGSTGCAIAYWNRERQPGWTPTSAGWRSLADTVKRPDYTRALALRPDAMRFSRGNPSHPSIFALGGSANYLSRFRMEDVQTHVQTLTSSLMEWLKGRGIPFLTPVSPDQHGASVCLESSAAKAIVQRLETRGIYASNGRGRVRFGFHGFNDLTEVVRIAAALEEEWQP